MPTDDSIEKLSKFVREYDGPSLRVMEVCGTHTHENFRLGIRSILPKSIKVISGPGCPVCVTPASYIDEALYIASKGAVICSFGDLLRVPGLKGSLSDARAKGVNVRVVYSPLDALEIAKENPQKNIVFLSVGFETTTPVSCIAAQKAYEEHINNFSLLTANKTMTNVYPLLADSVDAYLYPGHVSVITGAKFYDSLKEKGISGVVAGFTASELLLAFAAIITMSAKKKPFAVNCYTRVVTDGGNARAREITDRVMTSCDAQWRGLGEIKGSGMRLRNKYADIDARIKFNLPEIEGKEPPGCKCGDVLRGGMEPRQCPFFGRGCTPENPRGACMVSTEGACAAYYKYGRM